MVEEQIHNESENLIQITKLSKGKTMLHNTSTNVTPNNGSQNKLVSATEVAMMKRKIDGANKTIISCNKKIKLLEDKLEKNGISLAEKRIVRSKIIALKTKRYEAEQKRRNNETECREIVQINNRIHGAQLVSQRFEDKVLFNFDGYLRQWKQDFEAIAKTDDNLRDLQLRLVELACEDTRSEFNQTALALLDKMDDKVTGKLKYAKSLKPKFLNSLHEFFEQHPAYLPEPRVTRYESTLLDEEMEGENEDSL